MEEISETHARFACEAAWARGARLAVESDGVGFAAEVVRVERRETDLLVEVRFLDGYRWSVAEWAPNHLAGPLDPSRNQRLD